MHIDATNHDQQDQKDMLYQMLFFVQNRSLNVTMSTSLTTERALGILDLYRQVVKSDKYVKLYYSRTGENQARILINNSVVDITWRA